MPSLIDLRRRIRSVRNTQQITKAMKMVSAAKLRRAQERVVAARPYSASMAQMLSNVITAIADAGDEATSALMMDRPEKRIQVILITSDRGLAGAFNSNLNRGAQHFMMERQATSTVEIEALGRKGRDYFRKRGFTISGEYLHVTFKPSYEVAQRVAKKVTERLLNDEIDAVYLIYNEFKSVMSQKLAIHKILPVTPPEGGQRVDYIFEQPPAEILATMLPRYVEVQIYTAILETTAAEHAARMTAMDSASSNAADVIEKLTLHLNRVRQATITREIIEVVSGASALE
ncbi:MAG TPA: ATP synthase F1 subunit gamma [Bryobacteraceae bacterium]|nr:ATP synthase F1 subunit gamma [Bryobacteraceae bacterium]